jgi:hypothetical protein
MLVNMRGGHARQSDGTQFQGKRYAAGRHEAGGNIGAKQQQAQQPEAGRASSPANDGRPAHQRPAKDIPRIMANPP